jgi:PhnB protein
VGTARRWTVSGSDYPQDYHSVTPYLNVAGVDTLLTFLAKAFGAEETVRLLRADGAISHAEAIIGDSVVMMGEPQTSAESRPSTLYLFVPDVDATFERALKAGATTIMSPRERSSGDRTAAVRDPSGNAWWIATHIGRLPQLGS